MYVIEMKLLGWFRELFLRLRYCASLGKHSAKVDIAFVDDDSSFP